MILNWSFGRAGPAGVAVTLALLLSAPALRAATGLCDRAARQAAVEAGIPEAMLLAIARVESGRSTAGQFAPWPWTVNIAGDGAWFATRAEAVDHAAQAMAAGRSNIDLGCFQLNLRWHGTAFSSLDAMIDPARNARYAADFLRRLHDQHGSWEGAIGAYHSARAEAAAGYLAKVSQRMAALSDAPVADPAPVLRRNAYPLLQGAGPGSRGSLVATGGTTLIVPLFR